MSTTVSPLDLTVHIESCIAYEQTNGLKDRSRKSLNDYLASFSTYLEAHPISTLSDICTDYLREFIIQRTEVYDPVSDTTTKLGFSTVKGVIWSLHTLFGHLSLTGLVTHNPAAPIRYPKEHKQEKLPVYLSSKQLSKLLLWSAEHSRPTDFAIITLMCSTGMRPTDMASLTRFDYDAQQKIILPKVKGGWVKPTPVSNTCAQVLDTYLAMRTDSNTALFLNKHSKPVKTSYIQRTVKRAGLDAGLEISLTCNILRHTFATHACDRHGKQMTQALLGHCHSRTTDGYAHLSPRHFKALMNEHPHNQITGAK
jgi:integrase/recombinase XerC